MERHHDRPARNRHDIRGLLIFWVVIRKRVEQYLELVQVSELGGDGDVGFLHLSKQLKESTQHMLELGNL